MSLRKCCIALASLAMWLFVGCSNADFHPPKPNCDDPDWNYDITSKEGPNKWGDICYQYVYCKGGRQSPVNIINATSDATLPTPVFSYNNTSTSIVNTGKTLQWNYNAGSALIYDGTAYALSQFHFHTDAEHTVAGSTFPMEVHLVHKADNGKMLIVAILFTAGAADNAFLASFIPNLPVTANNAYTTAATYNVNALLPASQGFYTYSGSQTEPPCYEDVTWIVMKTPVTASAAQIAGFKAIMKSNNRPVMPILNRIIRMTP